jgi:hypothetical protein
LQSGFCIPEKKSSVTAGFLKQHAGVKKDLRETPLLKKSFNS